METPLSLAAEFPQVSDAEWRLMVEKTLGGRDFDKVMTSKTAEDIALKALYSEASATVHPHTDTRVGPWIVECGYASGDNRQNNTAILRDLAGGASAISVRAAAGETSGAPVESVADFELMLKGVYLNMIHIGIEPGEAFKTCTDSFLSYAAQLGVKPSELSASLGTDPFSVLATTGRLASSFSESLASAAGTALIVADAWPRVRTFQASGVCLHNAGGTTSIELGVMLSSAVTYLRSMEVAGMSLADAARQIEFTVAADADLYMTIAKMRAARRLWATVLDACDVKAVKMELTAVTGATMYSQRDPWVNVLRQTMACFGAGVGGADRINIAPHTSRIDINDPFARRIARNVQIVLQEESHLSKVVDPAAGSWALENLTSDLVERAWAEFQSFEATGGAVEALRSGELHARLQAMRETTDSDIARRKKAITGVSEFPNIHEDPLEGEPVAVHYASHREAGETATPLGNYYLAAVFEAFRDRSDAYKKTHGNRPSIFMANMGRIADHTARATFAKNWFEAIGLEAKSFKGSLDADEMVEAWQDSKAPFAVLCGTDGLYHDHGIAMIEALLSAGCKSIWLAGKPDDSMLEAGLDGAIAFGGDLTESADRLWSVLEGQS